MQSFRDTISISNWLVTFIPDGNSNPVSDFCYIWWRCRKPVSVCRIYLVQYVCQISCHSQTINLSLNCWCGILWIRRQSLKIVMYSRNSGTGDRFFRAFVPALSVSISEFKPLMLFISLLLFISIMCASHKYPLATPDRISTSFKNRFIIVTYFFFVVRLKYCSCRYLWVLSGVNTSWSVELCRYNDN